MARIAILCIRSAAISSRCRRLFSSNLPAAACSLHDVVSTAIYGSLPACSAHHGHTRCPRTRSPYKFHAELLDQYQSETAATDDGLELRRGCWRRTGLQTPNLSPLLAGYGASETYGCDCEVGGQTNIRTHSFWPPMHFYRAMHFSAKRGIAIACRLSVRLSVCNVGGL